MKNCRKCLEDKSDEEFYYHKNHTDHLSSYCRECTKQTCKDNYQARRRDDVVKVREHRMHVHRTYGLTAEQYEELFDKQSGCCAICKRDQKDLKFRLSVDHNHKTGAIRGLLCTNCNHRLIGRHTDGGLLRRMAEYVESDTGWFVPIKPKRRRRTARIKRK